MSLRPDQSSSRARSKSRSRSRSGSHQRQSSTASVRLTPDMYEHNVSPPAAYNNRASGTLPYPLDEGIPFSKQQPDIDMGDFNDYPPEERARLRAAAARLRDSYDENLAYESPPERPSVMSRSSSTATSQQPYGLGETQSTGHRYVAKPEVPRSPSAARPELYQHGKPSSSYSTRPQAPDRHASSGSQSYYTEPVTPPKHTQAPPSLRPAYATPSPRSSNARIMEVTPGVSKQSGLGLLPQMDRLSVGGPSPVMSGALPPPSPLLEPYHGTYQSISPMPSPMMLPRDGDLDELPPLPQLSVAINRNEHREDKHERSKHHRKKSSTSSGSKHHRTDSSSSYRDEKSDKKRVKVYDAQEDARLIHDALSHFRGPDADPICDVLPHLTHEQILELRSEYKRIARIQGRGINVAKHIKMKLGGNFGKAAYVTALGRWESEGYWANFWYQSHGSRRELLIESLMGRSNAEIRQIKQDFKDKRYSDDLVKCMEKELKADKFRLAVLTVLEERRQEETDIYPREYVDKDVAILHRCIMSREAGESTMLEIVTTRSDAHLREVLRTYDRQYQSNFARDALRKSHNLVVRTPPAFAQQSILTFLPGRSHSTQPQRRNQQTRPRRTITPPRDQRYQIPQQRGRAKIRTSHLSSSASALGSSASGTREAGL